MRNFKASSRGGLIVIKEMWSNYVKNDFMLATAADIVADPSALTPSYKDKQ